MTRQHETTEVRREQIVNAARKVIIRHGSEHVTIKRIAAVVGISETAIYRHFKSKKDVLSLLADHIEESLTEDLSKTAGRSESRLDVLEAALKSHLSAVQQRRGVSFQIIAEIISLGDKKLNTKLAHAINGYKVCLKDLLTEAVKAGELRADIDLDAAATVLFGMIQGLVNIWALNSYSFDPQEEFARLWCIFREAVVKR